MSIFGSLIRQGARRTTAVTGLTAGAAMNVGFGGIDYAFRKSEGQSTGQALAGAAFVTALWTFAPSLGLAHLLYTGGKGVSEAVHDIRKQSHIQQSKAYQANFGHGFHDTSARQTMRQRSVAAVRESGLYARSTLGQEAVLLHRNYMRGY